jgi:predicted phage baseplate assembly protein
VAEIDDEGEATLRFGDDAHGRRPLGLSRVQARLRTGGGRAGNLGAGALVHLVTPDPADPLDPANPGAALVLADVTGVYQPLSAREGADAETIAELRALAPEAHRALQFRAVTEADWVEVALRHPGVAAARASFRWTGSWHTVFVAIHPAEQDDLVRLPGGGSAFAPAFGSEIKAHLRRFKLAGYDLAVRAAVYVPLEIDVRLCIARGHRRGDVLAAAARALSARDHASGVPGFFHPSAFGFGEAVYLSQLYAVLEAIPGVGSAEVTLFKRYWQPASDELARGRIAMAPFEIARLASDPNHAEDGVLRLSAVGGL